MRSNSLFSSSLRNHLLSASFLGAGVVLAAGCSSTQDGADPSTDEAPPEASSLGQTSQELRGTTDFGTECTTTQRSLLHRGARHGRIVTASRAFEQCLRGAFSASGTVVNGRTIGPYTFCSGDPLPWASREVQLTTALGEMRSNSNLHHECSTEPFNNGVIAHTGQNDGLGHTNAERMRWDGPMLTTLAASLTQPACGSPGAPPSPNCNVAPYPWPFQNLAGVIWHEASHTRGYQHGDTSSNANARASCGVPSSNTTWNFQQSTLPYIVQACIEEISNQSARPNLCGASLTSPTCQPGELFLETAPNGSSCECVADPRLTRIGFMGRNANVTVGNFGVFATSETTGNVLRFDAATRTWNQIGSPGFLFRANDTGLFAITPDRMNVMRFDGAWTRIGGASDHLVVGGSRVYSVRGGTISRWQGGTSWIGLNGPAGATYVANGEGRLFALTSDRQRVLRFEEATSSWLQIGGAADSITAGGRYVYVTSADRTTVLRHHDTTNWVQVATQTPSQLNTYAANDVTLYRSSWGSVSRLDSDGRDSWDAIDSDSYAFYAGGSKMVVKRSNGELFEVTGP